MGKASKSRGRRPLVGYCNICNQVGELTEDHVPPRGSIELRRVEMRYIIERLAEISKEPMPHVDESFLFPIPRPRSSQNGVKFRTICANCNNVVLGKHSDPEIKRVSRAVGGIVRARFKVGLSLPSMIRVSVKTHLLMRGIIGHLLAARPSLDLSKPMPGSEEGFYKNLRDYVLDESRPLPPDVLIYYWPFPSQRQVIIKGLMLINSRDGSTVFGDLLKFFPLAYFVVNEKMSTGRLEVPSLHGNECNDRNCVVELYIALDSVPSSDWPEVPSPDHHTMMPVGLAVLASCRTTS